MRPRYAPTGRDRGRPHGGSVKVTAKRLAAMPDFASVTGTAKALGVAQRTVRQWVLRKTNPLPMRTERTRVKNQYGLTIIYRDELIAWLEQTKRIGG